MIRYALKCSDGHAFESWFQSAEAYDKLAAAGLVSCVVCGVSKVDKALMAPRVRPARTQVEPGPESVPPAPSAGGPQQAPPQMEAPQDLAPEVAPHPPSDVSQGAGPLRQPPTEAEQALAKLRKEVEQNSDYVGKDFAKEARAMHLGDTPGRAIHGEAGPEEAKALIEDGVPVLPLPFLPNRKTN